VEDLIIESERSRVVHMDHRFSFKYLNVLPAEIEEMDGYKVILDADKIVGKIRIRSRRDGDRFIPFGMNGFKKLKDFFIDEKVAKYDRDTIPIFADEEKILWVCPFRLDNRVRYDESSSRFLSIEAESLIKKSNRAASRKKRGTNEFDEL
jgi:tRNA(Ile)-lysidine synthase